MFVGHFAVALAAKRAAPRTSLGWLMAAATFLDLLWPILLLAGVERVAIDPGNTRFTPLDFILYPWSHSLVTALAFGVLAGALYGLSTRYAAGALAIAVAVISHWLLDALTHRPDLPLTPAQGSPKVGAGLWNSVAGTIAIESAIFGAGAWLYARATIAADRTGRFAFGAFLVTTYAIYLGNAFGPPPPDARAIPALALAAWLFPIWALWFDRHRVPAGSAR